MTRPGRSVREIAARIVYWGPRGSGKTETLAAICEQLDSDTHGQLLAPSDDDGHTLFMDFFTVEMGALDGIPVRLHIVGLPGADQLDESAIVLMRGADGFVFVADSRPECQRENRSALESLRRHLATGERSDRPVVLQFNRRDAADALPADRLAADLAAGGTADDWFETVAPEGTGVIEALTAVAARVIGDLSAAAEERSGT